ncbi:5'(3')-deoxyribonucleotidase family protein [Desulfonema limicola]|uniref:5'(3')-deoxyribonucleotidase family protein n=1 Tax=Desulfonema limicola TaxID=45656 RepID=A0A975B7K4_9BACT|nr:haloacid dehalogenase [Desulfonema limicola]QTA80283.1 5'(3')-deoxyribonucleotidase family protein [Desulfonema limicola]
MLLNEKIDPKSIGFDIDGVVADTMTLFLDIARNEHDIHHVRYNDITHYNLEDCIDIEPEIISIIIKKLLDGSYDADLKPLKGSIDVLNRLSTKHSPVCFVTARPVLKPIQKWMKNQLGVEDSQIDIIATGSFEAKTNVLLSREISWFVEDRLETCFILNDAGINPIVFKQPWNREKHPFKEIGAWHELESMIAF